MLYEKPDVGKINALASFNERVDLKHATIKFYLSNATIRLRTEDEALRCTELLGESSKLEQVCAIIVRDMLAHVQKKLDRGLELTPKGWN